jgi:hypothetical protein
MYMTIGASLGQTNCHCSFGKNKHGLHDRMTPRLITRVGIMFLFSKQTQITINTHHFQKITAMEEAHSFRASEGYWQDRVQEWHVAKDSIQTWLCKMVESNG